MYIVINTSPGLLYVIIGIICISAKTVLRKNLCICNPLLSKQISPPFPNSSSPATSFNNQMHNIKHKQIVVEVDFSVNKQPFFNF